jgi:HK97 family phage portal protein
MAWFSRNKKADEPKSNKADKLFESENRSNSDDCACSVTSDSLIFEQLFQRDFSYRSLSAVYACVEIIANSLASMPLRVVSEDEEGHREVVKHHPLQRIFKSRNVQTMTMPQIMKSVISDVLLRGNGYILINRNEAGLVYSLRYIPASAVSVQYDDYKDTLHYIVSVKISDDANKTFKVLPKDIIHITKTTRDGVNGQSVMHFAKSALDLAKSAEDAAEQWFESGMNVSGLLSCKSALTEKQRTDIKNSWTAGRGKNTLQILPLGVDYVALGVDAKSGMLLESRQYETIETARFFGVPVQLIQSGEKLTYNSLEQLNLLFLQHTLMPYISIIESEFTRKLFPDEDSLLVDMDENEFLLRTDKKSTGEYLSKLVGGGIMTVNEARKELGLGEVEDGESLHIAYSDASKAEIGSEKEPEQEQINTNEDTE